MSDTIASPFDVAIDTLRERERDLDLQAQSLIVRRDEVREMIALLTSRKPRAPRKARPASEAGGLPAPVAEGGAAAPFVFAPAFVPEPVGEAA
jgi:hypothetical protein